MYSQGICDEITIVGRKTQKTDQNCSYYFNPFCHIVWTFSSGGRIWSNRADIEKIVPLSEGTHSWLLGSKLLGSLLLPGQNYQCFFSQTRFQININQECWVITPTLQSSLCPTPSDYSHSSSSDSSSSGDLFQEKNEVLVASFSLWLYLFPLWLSCPWKSHYSLHRSFASVSEDRWIEALSSIQCNLCEYCQLAATANRP